MKHIGKRVWRWSAALFATAVILMATVIGLFRVLAPSVPQYREQIQAWASQAIGFPVQIGEMSARWRLLGPEVDLDRVALFSREGKHTVVTAEQIRIDISVWQLLRRRTFAPTRIVLVHPRIDLERGPGGSVRVRGLQAATGARGDESWQQLAGAMLGHGDIEVLGATVRWLDPRLPGGGWTFSDVGGELNSSAQTHRLRLAAGLPPTLGRDFSVDIAVDGPPSQPDRWQWQLDLVGRGLQVPELARLSAALPVSFRSGEADVRFSVAGDGVRVDSARGDVDASQVFARESAPQAGPPEAPAPGFAHLAAHAGWVRSQAGWHLSLDHVDVVRDGRSWPVASFSLDREQTGADGGGSWQAHGDFVRLQDLSLLAGWLPASVPGLVKVAQLQPTGDVHAFHLQYADSGAAGRIISAGGQFADLGVEPSGEVPGVSGLSGRLALNQDGGRLTLDSRDVVVDLPHLFRAPLRATTLTGDIQALHDAGGWRLRSDDIALANSAAKATATLDYRLPADGSAPYLELHASARDADLAQKSAYLPAGIMPQEVVAWLDSAIVSGSAPEARFVFRGHPGDFPFRDGHGLFEVDFNIEHALLDYGNGWPPVHDLSAHVLFHNEGLTVTATGGTVAGAPATGVVARFADLAEGTLKIHGRTAASASNLVEFIQHSPLGERFGPYVSRLQASGPAPVDLDLTIPVYDIERFALDGTVHLGGVSAGLTGLGPPVTGITGDLHFTGHGLSGKDIKAQFLGAEVTAAAAPARAGSEEVTRVTVNGRTAVAQLAKELHFAVPGQIQGGAAWTFTADLPNTPDPKGAGLGLKLATDLKGLAIDLPPPFGKTEQAATATSATLQFLKGDKAALQVSYGGDVDVLCRLETGAGWQLDRCNLHLGAGKPELPEIAGVTVSGRLPRLALADWMSGGGDRVPAAFKVLRLRVGTLDAWGMPLRNIELGVTRADSSWLLRVSGKQLKGTAVVPFKNDAKHPIVVDIAHADLPAVAATSTGKDTAQLDPTQLPALQLDAAKLIFAGMDLGRVDARLTPVQGGVRLERFQAVRPDSTLDVSGGWHFDARHEQIGDLDAKVHSTDVEQTLKAYGFNAGITANKADATARLNWTGAPGKGMLGKLTGKVHLDVEDGQLLDVQPGAGRVFGLLSFNALPRRLLLDFSDVFKKGFGFDSIQGDFLLEDGNAYTTNLKLSGPAADIHMLGRTGLVAHDYDQIVVVDSSISSSLPVAGAIAGGTGVGAVLLVLSEIFKKPLQKVGQVQYHVTGSWEHPQVSKIAAANGKNGGG